MLPRTKDDEYPYFCPDDCPPDDAPETNGTPLYRMVRGDGTPLDGKDFLATYEEGPNAFKSGSDCARAATSFFITDATPQYVVSIEGKHKGKAVARVTLPEGFGRFKPTGNNPEHRSVWFRTGMAAKACQHCTLVPKTP